MNRDVLKDKRSGPTHLIDKKWNLFFLNFGYKAYFRKTDVWEIKNGNIGDTLEV